MLVSCRTPQRRRRSHRPATTLGVVLLLGSADCSSDPPPEKPSTEPTTESTPLADYDTSGVAVVRDAFCDRVADDAIAAAVSDVASEVVGKVMGEKCRRVREAPDLGAPSVAQQCGGATSRTGIYGLVGDAWVGCEISGLTGAGTADIDLVGEWCVAVLEAMRSA